jgi:hypothetical protein
MVLAEVLFRQKMPLAVYMLGETSKAIFMSYIQGWMFAVFAWKCLDTPG